MEKKNLTCICCPIGCPLTVTLEDGKCTKVEGNTCKRGEKYGEEEIISPKRVVTTTVRTKGLQSPVISVKTKGAVPKADIFKVLEEINKVVIKEPCNIGYCVIDNVCGSGVSVVTTENCR